MSPIGISTKYGIDQFELGVALFLVVVLAGCRRLAVEEDASRGETFGAETQLPHGDVDVTGIVYARSDVQTIPDMPFASGIVVVVRSQDMPKLVTRIFGNSVEIDSFPPSLALSSDLNTEFGVTSSLLQPNGSYSLQLAPGNYFLGIGNLGQSFQDPSTFPVQVFGWAEVTVVNFMQHVFDIHFDGDSGAIDIQERKRTFQSGKTNRGRGG